MKAIPLHKRKFKSKIITEEKYIEVIDLFIKEKNNSSSVIALKTGLKYHQVSNIINKYFKEIHNAK